MFDLSKPLGTHEGIVFYGDHEQPNLVYYLPDQLQIPTLEQEGDSVDHELKLTIFKENIVTDGGLDKLEESSGSILSLGVECTVEPERMEKAKIKLAEILKTKAEELLLTMPYWVEGKVDLIVLDSSTVDESTIGQKAFVDAIVGSKMPSLNTDDLKSVFNVRLDRKGTALLAASLQGEKGHIAGVMYDLKFPALQQKLDLKISANLSRVQEKISHMFSANVNIMGYVSLGGQMEFVKQKLEEEGLIKVEVLSQATDPETKRMIKETVEEFKNKIIDKLFAPAIIPSDILAAVLGQFGNKFSQGSPAIVQLGYRFRKDEIFHNRVLEADYRERSVSLQTHNPQAHLWMLGESISDQLDRYIQTVNFGDLWRENSLTLELLHDFQVEKNDLLSAEVVIWRKKDGIAQVPLDSHQFAIPDTALPLGSFTFTSNNKGPNTISWIAEPDDPAGYYYQVRFNYDTSDPDIDSPATVTSEVKGSNSSDLIIVPQALAPRKIILAQIGYLDFSRYAGVDVIVSVKNKADEVISSEIISLKESHPQEMWYLRPIPTEEVYLEEIRRYHFKDNKPSINLQPRAVLDDEIIVNNPFIFNPVQIIPVIAGADPNRIQEVLLNLDYQPTDSTYHLRQLYRAKAPFFTINEIRVNTLGINDEINWKAAIITKDGELIEVSDGQTTGGAIIIDLKEKDHRTLMINWVGPTPEEEDLKYLQLEFKLIREDGSTEMLEEVEYSGDQVITPLEYTFANHGTLEMRSIKKYQNGRRKKGKFAVINTNEIVINP